MTTTSQAATTAAVKKPKVTKRQHIKNLQKSDLNRWPQQPNIKDPEKRAQAYLKVANLKKKTKEELEAKSLDAGVDLHAPEIKFGRMVGSNDVMKRHEMIAKLEMYLKERCRSENEGLSYLDLLKLWKGLWHCLYMADKVPVQDELSKRLSELLWCVSGTKEEDLYAAQLYLELNDDSDDESEDEEEGDEDEDEDEDEEDDEDEATGKKKAEKEDDDEESSTSTKSSDVADDAEKMDVEGEEDDEDEEEDDEDEDDDDDEDDSNIRHTRGAHLASIFIKSFFATIRREWGKMDKYRVDKFYTLIRLMMHQIYTYMGVREWHYGIIRLFNDVIFYEVLSQIPNGIRLHLIDLCLDELVKVEHEVGGVSTQIFMNVLEPYWSMCQMERDRVVRNRVMEKVVDKFLNELSVVAEGHDDKEKLIFKKVSVQSMAKSLFGLGSDEDTIDGYRESLYGAHKDYIKQFKKVGKDADDPDDVAAENKMDVDVSPDGEKVDGDSSKEEDKTSSKNKDKKKNTTENKETAVVVKKKDVDTDKDQTKSKDETMKDINVVESHKNDKSKKKRGREQEHTNQNEQPKADDKIISEEQTETVKDVEPETKKAKPTAEDVGTEVASKKKNKKKKKKKGKDKDTTETSKEEETIAGDAKADTPDTNKKQKDTDTKDAEKEVSVKENVQEGSDKPEETKEDHDKDEKSETASKKKKKKKNKKNKDKGKEDKNNANTDDSNAAATTTTDDKEKEDVITITTAEQKDAALAAADLTTPQKTKTNVDTDEHLTTSSKRVKFRPFNQAKSHKKSMKDLKTTPLPSTAVRTPDRSILMKKMRGEDGAAVEGGGDAGAREEKRVVQTEKKKKKKKHKKNQSSKSVA